MEYNIHNSNIDEWPGAQNVQRDSNTLFPSEKRENPEPISKKVTLLQVTVTLQLLEYAKTKILGKITPSRL